MINIASSSSYPLSNNATSAPIPKPSGLAVGDGMIALISAVYSELTIFPSGWSRVGKNDLTYNKVTVFKKIATQADVDATSFTWGGSYPVGGVIYRIPDAKLLSDTFTSAFLQDWNTQPYTVTSTTVNSVSGSILNITSTTNDPYINMPSLGSFSPENNILRLRYRVVSGTAGNVQIYFYNAEYTGANEANNKTFDLISDGAWHIIEVDMSTHTNWNKSNITGWRFDWCSNSGVNMEIDYIQLGHYNNVQVSTGGLTPKTFNNLVLLAGMSSDNDSDTCTFSGYSVTGGASPSFTENYDSNGIYSAYYGAMGVASGLYQSTSAITAFNVTADLTPDETSRFMVLIAGVDKPEVTTQAVSNVLRTSIVGNGNITKVGGANPHLRGFAYLPYASGDISLLDLLNPSVEDSNLSWGGAGTLTRSSTQKKYGSYALKVTWTSGSEAYGELVFATDMTRFQGKKITFGAWVWCDTPNTACLNLYDIGVAGYQSAFHSGNSTWEFLTVTMTATAGMTQMNVRCRIATLSATPNCYFDGMMLAYHASAYPSFAFDSGDYSTGAFTKTISGLNPNTAYRVCAFVQNAYGTIGGTTVSATTTEFDVPQVSTQSASSVLPTSANGNGTVIDDGGGTIISRGFEWGTTSGVYTDDITESGSFGETTFALGMTGLEPATTYYYRAFASNSSGIAYGSEASFTTPADLPTVTTQASTKIKETACIAHGTITDDGNASIIERGIVYSTNSNPTTGDNKVVAYGMLGAFNVNLSGLIAGTTYHVRAYAINSVGTAYGNEITFVAQPLNLILIGGEDENEHLGIWDYSTWG